MYLEIYKHVSQQSLQYALFNLRPNAAVRVSYYCCNINQIPVAILRIMRSIKKNILMVMQMKDTRV